MAELVGDHALKFRAIQRLQRTTRDRDCGIGRVVAGSESVDAGLLFQNVDFRHRHTRSNGHFFDHVEQALFFQVARIGIDPYASQRAGNDTSAAGQRTGFVQARKSDEGQHTQRRPKYRAGIDREPRPRHQLIVIPMPAAAGEQQ